MLGSPFALRALVAVVVCGLLCLGLEFFFPLGIRVVNQSSPGFLPWAWGINGGFSVIGSMATVVLALALGFNAVIAAARLVYAIGVLGMAWFCRGAGTQPDVQPMARRGLTWRRAYRAPAGA